MKNNNIKITTNKNNLYGPNILSGNVQQKGCYKCCNCGQKVYLEKIKELPKCPKCNCEIFEQI